jgi:hypothetical protein
VIINKYKNDFYFYGRRQGNGCLYIFRGLYHLTEIFLAFFLLLITNKRVQILGVHTQGKRHRKIVRKPNKVVVCVWGIIERREKVGR